MDSTHSFQTLFAVPMKCEDCVKVVSDALYSLEGVCNVEPMLEHQLVRVEGHASPSAIVEAIRATGKDAILRGSGTTDNAAVAILETWADDIGPAVTVPNITNTWTSQRHVRGLVRIVQVSSTHSVVDVVVKGVSSGTYHVTIRNSGDLSQGVSMVGPIWTADGKERGYLASMEVDTDGKGSLFVSRPFQVWEIIGRAVMVSKQPPSTAERDKPAHDSTNNDPDTIVGLAARSAGVWDNNKMVCSCTGKTLWDERKDQVKLGML